MAHINKADEDRSNQHKTGYKVCLRAECGVCLSPVNPQPIENFYTTGKKYIRSMCKACSSYLISQKALKRRKIISQRILRSEAIDKDKKVINGYKTCSQFHLGKCLSGENPLPVEEFTRNGKILNRRCKKCLKKARADYYRNNVVRAKNKNNNTNNMEDRSDDSFKFFSI